MEFLDQYDGILPNLPRNYGRVCCICGNSETYIYKGTPIWGRYKDENGNVTKEWACHKCHRKKKGHNNNELKCHICGSTETRIKSNGDPIWIKDIGNRSKDIGNRGINKYICYKCYYQTDKKCYKCGDINNLIKEYDNKYWSGKFICKPCLNPDYNGNLDQLGKGYISEILVARFLNIETCFDKTGVFNYKNFDIYDSEEWGRIDVKGSKLFHNNYHIFSIRKDIIPDFFFCIGYDTHRKHVDRVYIIPNEDYICKLDNLRIPKYGHSNYHTFRENEEPWDNLFHTLKLK